MTNKRKIPSSNPINIHGDGNIVGNNNVSIFQKDVLAQGASIQEFCSLLDRAQRSLDQFDTKSPSTQEIKIELHGLQEMVKKPDLEKTTVLSKLRHIEELISTGLGLSAAATQLIPVVESMIRWVTSKM